ncbi:unnamed protein product [Moneuplotes crassus]|uniref:Uncharacterized protein n=1 Tax=Euplotes crassus TaxID=5936 RepID=A0AAD1XBR0_EUPCR|nr:unnamed protein product [Moneuplotes crassus]
MDLQYETLLRQSMQQERDIAELKEMLETERAEKSKLFEHNEDNKLLIGKLVKELDVAKKKLTQELMDKKERRDKYEAEMGRLRQEIERRHREIQDVQEQAVDPMDMDILRVKIKKEFETNHSNELEEKQMIISQLKTERDEVRRELEFLNTKHENLKFDSQRNADSTKSKHKEEIQGLTKEIEHLQSQIEMSKDRDLLRQTRRELDESKRRIEEYQKECNEFRRERDALKDQINDLVISNNREIEEERSRKRELVANNDKLKFRIRALEDDFQKQVIENDKKAQSIIKFKTEKQSLNSLINEKEIVIDSQKRQIDELKDQVRDRENELQSHLRKRADFELVEKNRLEKLTSDLENLQKEYRIQEVERANEREKHSEQFNRLEYNHKINTEENRKLRAQNQELEKDLFTRNKELEQKIDEFLSMERDYKKYQDQNRGLLIEKQDLQKLFDNSRLEAKLEKEKNTKAGKAQDLASQAWAREKKDMEMRISKLLKVLENYKSEGTKEQLIEYKKKTNEYKGKVRAANDAITKLGRKLAILGAQEGLEEEYEDQYIQ